MKLFLDTADCELIAQWAKTGVIDGVTTNPTHLSKAGKNPREQVVKICSLLPHGIISVEVTETEPEKVYKQAGEIAELANNIIVKVPCHKDYYSVIKQLVTDGVGLNITLVFSLSQGLMMSKLGVNYISPFIGRLDDTGGDGSDLVRKLCHMVDRYQFSTHVLAASIRTVAHFENAVLAGAGAATVPVTVMQELVEHALTDKGMAQFIQDWKSLGVKQFP